MSMILVINGPNLNLLGKRQPEIYGSLTLADIEDMARKRFPDADMEWWQSNHEGEIIDKLHQVGYDKSYAGIVLNAGAYTHTSLAIADAIASIALPVVEVHLSNIHAREEIRRRSLIAPCCAGSISGCGAKSYLLAISALL